MPPDLVLELMHAPCVLAYGFLAFLEIDLLDALKHPQGLHILTLELIGRTKTM